MANDSSLLAGDDDAVCHVQVAALVDNDGGCDIPEEKKKGGREKEGVRIEVKSCYETKATCTRHHRRRPQAARGRRSLPPLTPPRT